MRLEYPILRNAARDETCVRCSATYSVVGAHYTGARRLAYHGGYNIKVHDICIAHLCGECHKWIDTLSRDKEKRWEHSEEFQHWILMTIIRLIERGILVVKGARVAA